MEKILLKPNPQTCRGSTYGREDSRVRTFLYLAGKEDLQENEALSFLKLLDCWAARQPKIDPNGLSLKMLKICSPLIGDGTLRPFWVRWPKSAIISNTDCLIHASTAFRKTENESTLSLIDILEPTVDEKYASDGKALIQLIGGTQGKRVYDPAGISCTLMSEGGGFAGRTGMYFIDLCKGNPKLTENARCIKARYDSGIGNRSADNSGVLCMGADCPDRTEETTLIQLKRGEPKIREQDYTKCLIAGYNKIGVSNRGESSGVFYGCRAVLTPDRENKRQNGRRFKECGEPAFCLNTQDKHGVYLCACDSCEHALKIKNATAAGYAEAKCGDSINLAFPDSNTRRGRVGKGCVQTLDTSCNQGVPLGCGRIRKLTPRECWRLQGFSDDMFDKAAAVNSDAQLYKQAGNGVTIPVVYAVGKRIVEIQNELNSEVKI